MKNMNLKKILALSVLLCTMFGMGITTIPSNACVIGVNGCGTHTVSGDWAEAGHGSPNLRYYYYRVTFSFTYDGSEVISASATGSSGTIYPWYGGQQSGYPTITYGNPTVIHGYAKFGEFGANNYPINIYISIYPDGSVSWYATGSYDYLNSNF